MDIALIHMEYILQKDQTVNINPENFSLGEESRICIQRERVFSDNRKEWREPECEHKPS